MNPQRSRSDRDDSALKPIGFAVAALMAGLGSSGDVAHAEEAVTANPAPNPQNTRSHYVDPTNHPAYEQDDTMVLGPSEPVEPFSAPPGSSSKTRQGDLFER